MNFLESAPRNLFFTGKGGVGKTSVACASAIALSERGQRVLLVSTDPASNLDEVLEAELGASPCAIEEVPGLFALNIDPVAAVVECACLEQGHRRTLDDRDRCVIGSVR